MRQSRHNRAILRFISVEHMRKSDVEVESQFRVDF
jgi:hypothetical protein